MKSEARPAEARDPVCGMTVGPNSPHRLEHDGQTYLFCSAGCLAKFEADPSRYLGRTEPTQPGPSSPVGAVAGGRDFTCPMHPEVRQQKPGSCPKCGKIGRAHV